MIELMREYCSGRPDGEHFGSHCDRALLITAVAIGQLEGRPMSASKVAQYVGIPRATAIRKLEELGADGLITKTEEKTFVRDVSHVSAKVCTAMERLVRNASTELSKLDSADVAGVIRKTYTPRTR